MAFLHLPPIRWLTSFYNPPKKIKRLYVTQKGKEIYPFIIRENQFSNSEALKGFSEKEAQQVHDYLVRIRQNIDGDWDIVKHGGKRQY